MERQVNPSNGTLSSSHYSKTTENRTEQHTKSQTAQKPHRIRLKNGIKSHKFANEIIKNKTMKRLLTIICAVVSISTLDCGEASITATYTNNDTIAVIKVFVNYWEGKKIEEIGKSETLSPEVLVESKDTETKQLIEKELWNYIDQRKGSLYSFDGDTKQFTIEITQLGEKHQGTYRWSIDSLTLSYNDTIEKYAFQMFPRRDYYKIQADKTEEYQSKYPKASITSVKISRIWYDSDKLHIQ